jgi:hypothetical protein
VTLLRNIPWYAAYAALAGTHEVAAVLPNGTFYFAAGNGSAANGVYPGFPFAAAPARAVPLGFVAALALAAGESIS